MSNNPISSATALIEASRAIIAILQQETADIAAAIEDLKKRSAAVLAREDRATMRERELAALEAKHEAEV